MKRKPAIGGEKKRKLAATALGNISDILVTFEKLEVAPFPSSAGATANFISLQASLLISSQTLRLVAAQSISGASRNSVNVQLKAQGPRLVLKAGRSLVVYRVTLIVGLPPRLTSS